MKKRASIPNIPAWLPHAVVAVGIVFGGVIAWWHP